MACRRYCLGEVRGQEIARRLASVRCPRRWTRQSREGAHLHRAEAICWGVSAVWNHRMDVLEGLVAFRTRQREQLRPSVWAWWCPDVRIFRRTEREAGFDCGATLQRPWNVRTEVPCAFIRPSRSRDSTARQSASLWWSSWKISYCDYLSEFPHSPVIMAATTLPPANITQALFTQLLSTSTASSSALRLDSRSPNTPLDQHVTYSPTQRGTVTLTLSAPHSRRTRTIVQCCVQAELVEPREDRPYEGQISIHLNPNVAFATSSASRSSASSDALLADLERQTDLALRKSGLVDREALCLKAGQLVWNLSIHLHLHTIHAGNALSACIMAAALALADFRRNDAAVEQGGKIVVYDERERVMIPLPITGGLVAVEIAVFLPPSAASSTTGTTAAPQKMDTDEDDNGAATGAPAASIGQEPVLLVDPTPLEVQLSSALLTYVLTPNTGQFLVSEKMGRAPVEIPLMLRAMKLAESRAKAIGTWQEQQKAKRDESMGKDVR